MKQIDPSRLIDIQAVADSQGIQLRTRPVYASPDNFLGEAIYRPDAQIWLYDDLANIVLAAARRCASEYGFIFVLTDGLRTVDAQEKMLVTKRTLQNPQWIEDQMLSKPGFGGHPRGMAVDIILEDSAGLKLDMGTELDDMSAASARDYTDLPEDVLERRHIMERLMRDAAEELKQPLFPLPSEWWDFRFPPHVYEEYAPLSDADLPLQKRMCS
jgi:D-alanyl-D-alanine dipeptidase